jgi:divalent metal cation (Fe/Co/Zn/Cd) transporter
MRSADLEFENLRTRESGRHRFVSLTVLVPANWTVERGHALADDVEVAISLDLPDTDVQTHLEPQRLP